MARRWMASRSAIFPCRSATEARAPRWRACQLLAKAARGNFRMASSDSRSDCSSSDLTSSQRFCSERVRLNRSFTDISWKNIASRSGKRVARSTRCRRMPCKRQVVALGADAPWGGSPGRRRSARPSGRGARPCGGSRPRPGTAPLGSRPFPFGPAALGFRMPPQQEHAEEAGGQREQPARRPARRRPGAGGTIARLFRRARPGGPRSRRRRGSGAGRRPRPAPMRSAGPAPCGGISGRWSRGRAGWPG